MSIVERMSRAIVAVQTGIDVGAIKYVHDEATRCARAALQSIRAVDITDAMCHEFVMVGQDSENLDEAINAWRSEPGEVRSKIRRAIAAAIAAGAEQ